MIDFGFTKDPFGHFGNAPENPAQDAHTADDGTNLDAGGGHIEQETESYFASRLRQAIIIVGTILSFIAIALILYALITS